MLGGDTGKLIVGICTAIFLFIMITGIVLWWPRNSAILKHRLKIKSDAGFKRLNPDYHIVIGFYSAIFLFVFAFTGLAWSFEWFNKAIHTVTGSKMVKQETPKNINTRDSSAIKIEGILQSVVAKDNQSTYYNIALPKDSTETFAVTTLPADAAHESATDTYYVDAHTKYRTKKIASQNGTQGKGFAAPSNPFMLLRSEAQPQKSLGS